MDPCEKCRCPATRMSSLEQIRYLTSIAIDVTDINFLKKYPTHDATMNATMVRNMFKEPNYRFFVDKAVRYAQQNCERKRERIDAATDMLFIIFGCEILKMVSGRVSSEINLKYSYDTEKLVEKGRKIMKLYNGQGFKNDRILLKIAATWEGLQAAKVLEKEGIHCVMILIFNIYQAIACGDAEVTMITPFLGRIYDWYVDNDKKLPKNQDPGVKLVTDIYNYFKKFNFKTEICVGSFRTLKQIKSMAGCDIITINPTTVEELKESRDPIKHMLNAVDAQEMDIEKITVDETLFKQSIIKDKMVSDKLSEGIQRFAEDTQEIQDYLAEELAHGD